MDQLSLDELQAFVARAGRAQAAVNALGAGPPGLVRTDHPDTAHAAAAAIAPSSGRLRARVLAYLTSRGTRGATDEEMLTELGLAPSSGRPRRVELVRDGLVRDSGTVRPTRARRNAIVWVAEDA